MTCRLPVGRFRRGFQRYGCENLNDGKAGNSMEKIKKDLSNPLYADESRNQTAICAVTIMNLVLTVAYLIEVFKGSRAIPSYIFVAASCILPSVISVFVFLKKRLKRITFMRAES